MDLVRLKGTGDGVKIYLSPEEEFSLIIQALREKLDEFRKFFGSGHCNIYIIGRELGASDKMRLEAIISAMLPESAVNYGERKIFRAFRKEKEQQEEKEEEISKGEEEAKQAEEKTENENESENESEKEKENENESEKQLEQIKEVVTGNFKSSRARFFEGVVRDGRVVESDGHMVLMGTVEEGGRLVAVGNIIVMGGIYGEAVAGCMGNDGAYIAALDLSPTKIDIAGRVLEPQKSENEEISEPKKAFLINNEIKIEKFWLK